MSIQVKQHKGTTVRGSTQAYAFDDVLWDDGGVVRKIAVVGHGASDPIQWLPPDAPDAVKAEARREIKKQAEAREQERKKREARDKRGGGSGVDGSDRPEQTAN